MRALLTICLLVAVSACGSEPVAIEWDLSGRPTTESIGWASRFDDIWNVDPVDEFHVVIDGRSESFDNVNDLNVCALTGEGGFLDFVQVDFQPQTIEDSYRQILEIADTWELDPEPIEAWIELRRSLPPDGGGHFDRHLGTHQLDPAPLNEAGLQVSLGTRYSFNDAVPVIVVFAFEWPKLDEVDDTLDS